MMLQQYQLVNSITVLTDNVLLSYGASPLWHRNQLGTVYSFSNTQGHSFYMVVLFVVLCMP